MSTKGSHLQRILCKIGAVEAVKNEKKKKSQKIRLCLLNEEYFPTTVAVKVEVVNTL